MHITIVVYRRCWAMNVITIKDLVHIASLLERRIYQQDSIACSIVSMRGAAVESASGTFITPDCSFDEIRNTDLIVIPAIEGGGLDEIIEHEAEIIQWLTDQRSKSVPILALSTGVTLLGKGGLLDQQIISTHWAFLSRYKKRYPNCRFTSHSSFIESDGIFSTDNLLGGLDAIFYHLAVYRGDTFSKLCAAHGLLASPEHVTPVLPGRRNHLDMDIAKVQDWIEENHYENLSISRASELFCFSDTGLKRRLKKATGLSFTQYLQTVRIEKSKRLLLSTAMNVKEISYAVGYENQSFFIRLFKKLAGTTPRQYRSAIKSSRSFS